ncbi:MAG: hypothetical protein HC896_03735 [Bacteroidales bacterium]|nr:hypothetical protein [Bacteroidales bacterium]
MFLATGTGISPFHSIVNSLPGLNYKLLHGVRYINEGYDKADYDKKDTYCAHRARKKVILTDGLQNT